MREKIECINKLSDNIEELQDFFNLLDSTDIMSCYGADKRNEFISLAVESAIWTGTQNPSYHKCIKNKEVINELSKLMKIFLRIKITELDLRLKELLK